MIIVTRINSVVARVVYTPISRLVRNGFFDRALEIAVRFFPFVTTFSSPLLLYLVSQILRGLLGLVLLLVTTRLF